WRRIERATTALSVPEYWRWPYLHARQLFAQERVWTYQFVLFHDVFTLFFCLDLLKQNQKVILQPHMPELPSQEVASLPFSTPEIVRWVEEAVTPAAFGRADIVILPNEGVLPIYESLISNSAKLVYLPSGAEQRHAVTQIPLDPQYLFFLYVG